MNAESKRLLEQIVTGNYTPPLHGLIKLYEDGEISLTEVQYQIPLPPMLRKELREEIYSKNLIHGINKLDQDQRKSIIEINAKHCSYTEEELIIRAVEPTEEGLHVTLSNNEDYIYTNDSWYKSKKDRQIIISGVGGNSSKNAETYKLSLTRAMIDELGTTREDRSVEVFIRDGEIVIRKK